MPKKGYHAVTEDETTSINHNNSSININNNNNNNNKNGNNNHSYLTTTDTTNHTEMIDYTKADVTIAFKSKDAQASKLLHEARANTGIIHEEAHNKGGDHIKTMIFGGLDGVLTSFAIVAGASGGNLGWQIILVMGFSNIFADALSMGVGEFLSSKAHNDYVCQEKTREEWELKNHREGEIQEMIEIYVDRGMEHNDANDVVRKMAKYDEFFVNVMMVEELGLQVPEEDSNGESLKEGFVMFLAFIIFGSCPLLGYAIFPFLLPGRISETMLFSIACIVTGLTLFFLGAVKSKFGTRKWYESGTEMLLLGGTCAAVAYELGNLVNGILGE